MPVLLICNPDRTVILPSSSLGEPTTVFAVSLCNVLGTHSESDDILYVPCEKFNRQMNLHMYNLTVTVNVGDVGSHYVSLLYSSQLDLFTMPSREQLLVATCPCTELYRSQQY